MAAVLARGTLLYLGAVNVGAAGLVAYDKAQATRGGWRVSERRLCQSALVGGWPGGLLAMQAFRHKTKKKSFQKKYVSALSSNALVLVPTLLLLSRSPVFRYQFSAAVRGFADGIGRSLSGKPKRKRNPPRNRR